MASAQVQHYREEKPLFKKQVPETNWLRVITNLGNVFYFDKSEKKSLWTIPHEVASAVTAMEEQERADELKAQQDILDRLTEVEEDKQAQVDRVKKEMKGIIKRKPDEETPIDELVIAKKARIDGESEDDDESEEDEEEEWQREAAAQLAAEAEEERKRQEEEQKRKEEEEKQQKEVEAEGQSTAGRFNMPERVDLSTEEAKALFKVGKSLTFNYFTIVELTFSQTLLREKDINPLEPWDTSLPKFINDPRYVLIPSVAARREAFDDYCRERAREIRESAVKREKLPSDPRQDFERLLEQEITSTRTSWTEFRRAWKKDRRFYGWGRDEREREKRFRDFVKDLGESECYFLCHWVLNW